MIVVVMGVCGAGKSTVGRAVAATLGARFLDGDAVHPTTNREKMAAGLPLDDVDRDPWLATLADLVAAADAGGESLVVASSALKRSYRARFRSAVPGIRFVHLDAPPDALRERLRARQGHFLPPALLESQLATLEAPDGEEGVLVVDATASPAAIAASVAAWLRP